MHDIRLLWPEAGDGISLYNNGNDFNIVKYKT